MSSLREEHAVSTMNGAVIPAVHVSSTNTFLIPYCVSARHCVTQCMGRVQNQRAEQGRRVPIRRIDRASFGDPDL